MPKIGVRKAAGPSALPRPSSASSAPALPPQGRQRLPAPIPIPDKDYTLAEARSFLPQPVPKGVHLAINKNAAWEVKYNEKPSPPYSHTRSFEPGCARSSSAALRSVLAWAWRVHIGLTGAHCPHDFGVML